jgi:hypothetical protein
LDRGVGKQPITKYAKERVLGEQMSELLSLPAGAVVDGALAGWSRKNQIRLRNMASANNAPAAMDAKRLFRRLRP